MRTPRTPCEKGFAHRRRLTPYCRGTDLLVPCMRAWISSRVRRPFFLLASIPLKISREPPELLPIDGPVTIAVHQGEKHPHRRARKPMYSCSLFVYYKNSNRPLQGSTPVKSRSNSTTPSTVKGTVGRGRLPNAHYRVREYLTQKEVVERLMKAACDNRRGDS